MSERARPLGPGVRCRSGPDAMRSPWHVLVPGVAVPLGISILRRGSVLDTVQHQVVYVKILTVFCFLGIRFFS